MPYIRIRLLPKYCIETFLYEKQMLGHSFTDMLDFLTSTVVVSNIQEKRRKRFFFHENGYMYADEIIIISVLSGNLFIILMR